MACYVDIDNEHNLQQQKKDNRQEKIMIIIKRL